MLLIETNDELLLLLFCIIPSRYQDARHRNSAWHQTFLSSPDQFAYQKDLCNVLKSRNHQRIRVAKYLLRFFGSVGWAEPAANSIVNFV